MINGNDNGNPTSSPNPTTPPAAVERWEIETLSDLVGQLIDQIGEHMKIVKGQSATALRLVDMNAEHVEWEAERIQWERRRIEWESRRIDWESEWIKKEAKLWNRIYNLERRLLGCAGSILGVEDEQADRPDEAHQQH